METPQKHYRKRAASVHLHLWIEFIAFPRTDPKAFSSFKIPQQHGGFPVNFVGYFFTNNIHCLSRHDSSFHVRSTERKRHLVSDQIFLFVKMGDAARPSCPACTLLKAEAQLHGSTTKQLTRKDERKRADECEFDIYMMLNLFHLSKPIQ